MKKVPTGLGLGASFWTEGSSEVAEDLSTMLCQVETSTPFGMGVSSHAMCLLCSLATNMTCFRDLHLGSAELRSRAPASAMSTVTSVCERSWSVNSCGRPEGTRVTERS